MELRFENRASISKWCFDFEMKLQSQNRALILKWSFDFEMERRFMKLCLLLQSNNCKATRLLLQTILARKIFKKISFTQELENFDNNVVLLMHFPVLDLFSDSQVHATITSKNMPFLQFFYKSTTLNRSS